MAGNDLHTRIIISAQDNASKAFKSLEDSVNSVKNSVNAFLGLQITNYLSGWVNGLRETAESYQTLSARLKLVVTDSGEYTKAQKELFEIAQRSRGSLEGTIGLYTGVAEKIKELGGNAQQTGAVVETVNKAIALTSQGVQQDAAALLQFKQAINSATLAGDELKSILENSPALARAMADGLGVSVGALKKLGAEGKLTSSEIINALLKVQGTVDEKFASIPLTIGQAITRVNNSWQQYIGKANEASDTTSKVADVIAAAGDNIPQIVSSLTTLAEIYGVKLVGDIGKFAASMAQSSIAKKEAQAVTNQVVAAEKELVAAMAQGGTQTTRYQNAQQELNNVLAQGGTATAGLARRYEELQQVQARASATQQKLVTAQAELNDAMIAGGSATTRYGQAQAGVNAAKQNAQAITQRLATAQADLNAEIAASGTGSAKAIALQQELNTVKLAAQQATARLATAEAELSAALTAGGTQTARYAAAYQQVTIAQNTASAAAATLQTKTEALTLSTNTATIAASKLEATFNRAFSAFAGWEIGTMVGEWLNQFQTIQKGGTYIAEFFVKLTEEARFFFSMDFLTSEGREKFRAAFDEIEKNFAQQRESIGQTNEAVKQAELANQAHAEAFKQLTLIVTDSVKQMQDKLQESTEILKQEYQLQTGYIQTELDLRIEHIKKFQKNAEDGEKQIFEATREAQEEQIYEIEKLANKRIELTDNVYKKAIETTKEGTKERESIEREYEQASAKIHQDSLANYQNVISGMIQAAQSHRDQALQYANDALDIERQKVDGLRELARMDMTDAEKVADRKKEIDERLTQFKKLMEEGRFEEAKKYSEETAKLAFKLAEEFVDSDGKVISSNKEKYKTAMTQASEAATKLKEVHTTQANELDADAKKASESMDEAAGKLSAINKELAEKHFLAIEADSSQIDTAKQKIDEIPRDIYVTTHVQTVQQNQNGGQIQYFATGGQPKFIRREGGLGGYGGGDTVPAMLEPGEWIIKKESVNKYGNGFMAQLNEGKLDIPRFSTGGRVDDIKERQNSYKEQIDELTKEMKGMQSAGDLGSLSWAFYNPFEAKAIKDSYNDKQRQVKKLQQLLAGTEDEMKTAQRFDKLDAEREKEQKAIDDENKRIVDEQRRRDEQVYKQKEETLKLQGDDVGLENLRYEREKQELAGNAPALQQAAINNQLALAKIQEEKQKKAQQEAEKAAKEKADADKKAADEAKKIADEKAKDADRLKIEGFKLKGDDVGLENFNYEKEKQSLSGNQEALKQAELNHQARLEKLKQKEKPVESAKATTTPSSQQQKPQLTEDEIRFQKAVEAARIKREYEDKLETERKKLEIESEKTRYEYKSTATGSSQTITIQFVSPTGASASGSFTQNDASAIVDILKEAAASGSTFEY